MTPLPALGVQFEIDDTKGPIIESPITSMDAVRELHSLDLSRLTFVGDALGALRQEVGAQVCHLSKLAHHVMRHGDRNGAQEHDSMQLRPGSCRTRPPLAIAPPGWSRFTPLAHPG